MVNKPCYLLTKGTLSLVQGVYRSKCLTHRAFERTMPVSSIVSKFSFQTLTTKSRDINGHKNCRINPTQTEKIYMRRVIQSYVCYTHYTERHQWCLDIMWARLRVQYYSAPWCSRGISVGPLIGPPWCRKSKGSRKANVFYFWAWKFAIALTQREICSG